jgi:hypothetical protein
MGLLGTDDLWWRYVALGGSAVLIDVELYLNGLMCWSAHEHNVLGQALNEQLWDTGQASLVTPRSVSHRADP